ncbi:MAG: Zn-ribbon domain-containing OB-fold protein [Syntrophomonadaceae bacterium]|nr:Zn-ribbon domain-containing OB-fold protein [Syntrophomonadaceae bacterium]
MDYKLTWQEYNKSLKKDKLLGLKCTDCGNITCPPMMVCAECASTNLEVVQMSGNGKITTFTTSYIGGEGRENELPYTIVMVALDEGPWIMGNLVSMDPKKVTMEVIGKTVELGSRVFPGDKYSNGDMARPAFSIIE